MKNNVTRFNNALLVILGVILSVSTAFSAVPNSPKDIRIDAGSDGNVYFMWSDNDNVDGYNIYRYEGQSKNTSDFQKIDLDSNLMRAKNMVWYTLWESDGVYSYYLTAYNSDGESQPSQIQYVKVSNYQDYENIWWTKYPKYEDCTIGQKETFSTTFEAKTNKNNVKIVYDMVDGEYNNDLATLDASTGKFTFTPEKSGTFIFTLTAQIENSKYNFISYGLYVYVRKCDVGATVSGNVTDNEGKNLKTGYVSLFQKYDSTNSKEDFSSYREYYSEFKDGKYAINNVDEGEYYLFFQAYDNMYDGEKKNDENAENYVPEYFNNAVNFEDAELIKIECDKKYTFNADLEKIQIVKGIVEITSKPITTAKIGSPYSYQVEYKTDIDPNLIDVIFYLNTNAENAQINKTTGLIEWTPKKSGNHYFSIVAQPMLKNSNNYGNHIQAGYQEFAVSVINCDNPAIISGKVTDEKDNPIEMGWATLFIMQEFSDSTIYIDKVTGDTVVSSNKYLTEYQRTEIVKGEYSFKSVDKGEYYLFFDGNSYRKEHGNDDNFKMFISEWYDNVIIQEEAKLIIVNCGETYTANAKLKELPNHNSYIKITSMPEMIGKIGDEWTYQVKYETNLENADIAYKLNGPEGATIDENGLIKWTPQTNGNFYFDVIVYDKNYEDVNYGNFTGYQSFTVVVTKCDVLATLNLNLKDEDGEIVKNGWFMLFTSLNDFCNNGTERKDSVGVTLSYYGEFKDGEALINTIDEGSYYLLVNGMNYNIDCDSNDMKMNNYYPYWYEGKYNYYEADQIEFKCGDSKSISVVLEKIPEPNYYTVSGKIIDKNTKESIPSAIVVFVGKDKKTKQEYYYEAMVSKKGTYEIKLPDNSTYIAYAYNAMYNEKDWWQDSYIPVFYDNTTDRTEAKEIVLTSNIQNINFELAKKKDYENKIYGTVLGADGSVITTGSVVSYLIKAADDENKIFEYSSQVSKIGDKGEFTFANNIPGKYLLFAIADNFSYIPGYYKEGEEATKEWEDGTQIAVSESGQFGSFEIILPVRQEGVRGNGRIRGSIGKKNKAMVMSGELSNSDPLLGAHIYAIDQNGKTKDVQHTDNNGSFTISGLNNGEYKVIVDKVGYSAYSAKIVLDENKNESDITIELVEEKALDVDNNNTAELSVFPNPASRMLAVDFKASNGDNLIELVNNSGQIVLTENKIGSNTNSTVILNINNISSGSYFVRITNSDGIKTSPIIISK